ncbi:hypothetical protein CALCODRAFT_493087 [Calocera cornea HHB12733]|uniref:Uncharacterized protein n=1 Tax=Calocera cornea HHB12733 TaxID=1353952 RepID=A0A165HWK1_9BASI|nr:hypothetical protein CALCODRAFT_493087 [Calocera cornea HHB12733]
MASLSLADRHASATYNQNNAAIKKKQRRPWAQLPEDILRLVLEDAHAADPRVGLAASHVCGYWRAVALTTPRLWNNISSARAVEATVWLQRSMAVPFELTLLNKSYDDLIGIHLLKAIVANLYRVKQMDIKVFSSGNPLWIRQIFLAFDRPALMLESLSFELQMPFPWPQVSKHTTMFGGIAPKLSSMTIKLPQDESGWTTPFFIPSLKQLTLAQTSDLHSWKVWDKAYNLRRLRMEDVTWSDSHHLSSLPLTFALPHLECLSLRRVPRSTAVSVITAITAPALTYLSIDLRHPPDRQAGVDIVNALKRSHLPLRQLRTLRIQVAACREEECLELLAQLPNVERLSFYNADMDTWLRALGSRQPGTQQRGSLVCPQLRTLILNICELRYASVLQLAARRRWAHEHELCAKLGEVSLQFCYFAQPDRFHPMIQPDAPEIDILLPLKWRGHPLSTLWYSEY